MALCRNQPVAQAKDPALYRSGALDRAVRETSTGERMDQERLDLPSASNWPRYERCAGAWQLEQEAKRLRQSAHEEDSPAARRGSLIHAYLAGVVDEDGSEIKLDFSEQQSADFLQQRATEQVHRIFGDEPTLELTEKRLWLTVNGRKAASGRFDRVTYTPTVALVQDFKTGWSEPDPAEQNSQLKMLAVLVAVHLPRTLREVIVQIISGPFGVTEARYDLAALAKAYESIVATLRALQDPFAPLSPSPEACRYCPAINICQAVQDKRPALLKIQWTALPDCNAAAAELLSTVEVLAKHLEAIRAYYQTRMEENPNYQIPGWGLVPGAVRREVTDWEAARARLGEYIELEDIQAAANYRLMDLERALGKKLGLRGKDLKERMGEILQGLIEEKPNAASLKRVKGEPKLAALTQ
jgi:RecB family exonuclease